VSSSAYESKSFLVKQPPTIEEFGKIYGAEAMNLIEEKESMYIKLLSLE